MNENEEIVTLLKSINQHLEGLDEAMLDMKKQIDYIGEVVYRKQMGEEYEAINRSEHPEEYEKQPDPQIQEIINGLNLVNKNIVTGANIQRIHHDHAMDVLNVMRDELFKYYKGIVDTIEALRGYMY